MAFNESNPDPHPWAVERFFRIEAILRSESAHIAHRAGESQFLEFLQNHDIRCDPLNGGHHALIMYTGLPDSDDGLDAAYRAHGVLPGGITDLTELVKLGPSIFWPKGGEREILDSLRNPPSQYVYIKLDLYHGVKPLLEALSPYLKEKREAWEASSPQNVVEEWYRTIIDPVFWDVGAWVKYLQCYDLLVSSDSLSYGQIAQKVYGTPRGRDTAENAIREIERIIAAAETKNWPPRRTSR